jgi:hypothetical protein
LPRFLLRVEARMSRGNKRCHCGSGKKLKNCHGLIPTRPRVFEIEALFDSEVRAERFTADAQTGAAAVYSDGARVEAGTWSAGVSVRGAGQRRLVNRVFIRPGEAPGFDANALFLDRYAALYAVDTNTDTDKHLSVSCMVHGIVEERTADRAQLRLDLVHVFAMWDVAENQENTGWVIGIQRILQHWPSPRVGIVVDSDLSNLASYNDRRAALMPECFLPNNMQLVFATRNYGTAEYIPNKMIAAADSQAKLWMRKLTADYTETLNRAIRAEPGAPFSRYLVAH